MSGTWEKLLSSMVTGADWAMPDVDTLQESLSTLHPVLSNVASESGLQSGQAAEASQESMVQTAKSAQQLSEAAGIVQKVIASANLARSFAADKQASLPPGELTSDQQTTIAFAQPGTVVPLGTFSVIAGPTAIDHANQYLAAQRELAAHDAYHDVKESINATREDVPLTDPDKQTYDSGPASAPSSTRSSRPASSPSGGGSGGGGSASGGGLVRVPPQEIVKPVPGVIDHSPITGDGTYHPGVGDAPSGGITSSGSPIQTGGLGLGLAGALGGGAAMVVGSQGIKGVIASPGGAKLSPSTSAAAGGVGGRPATSPNIARGRGLASGLREGTAETSARGGAAVRGRGGAAESEGGARGGGRGGAAESEGGARGGAGAGAAGARGGLASRGARGGAGESEATSGRGGGAARGTGFRGRSGRGGAPETESTGSARGTASGRPGTEARVTEARVTEARVTEARGAAASRGGSTSGSAAGERGAVTGAGRLGSERDRERERGRGLGGAIAPKLEDEGDALPRSEAAGAGGRD